MKIAGFVRYGDIVNSNETSFYSNKLQMYPRFSKCRHDGTDEMSSFFIPADDVLVPVFFTEAKLLANVRGSSKLSTWYNEKTSLLSTHMHQLSSTLSDEGAGTLDAYLWFGEDHDEANS